MLPRTGGSVAVLSWRDHNRGVSGPDTGEVVGVVSSMRAADEGVNLSLRNLQFELVKTLLGYME